MVVPSFINVGWRPHLHTKMRWLHLPLSCVSSVDTYLRTDSILFSSALANKLCACTCFTFEENIGNMRILQSSKHFEPRGGFRGVLMVQAYDQILESKTLFLSSNIFMYLVYKPIFLFIAFWPSNSMFMYFINLCYQRAAVNPVMFMFWYCYFVNYLFSSSRTLLTKHHCYHVLSFCHLCYVVPYG